MEGREEEDAVYECFDFMKEHEWPAVADALQQYHFPHKLELELPNEKKRLQEYLESIIAETKRMDIKGIYSRSGSGKEAIHFPIEDIYTPLKTQQRGKEIEDTEGSNIVGERRDERVPLTELLSKHRRLLLIGEPGGGKTTFLKLIACVLSKDALGVTDQGRKQHLGMSLDKPAPVPIFMRLAVSANLIKDGAAYAGSGAPGALLKRLWKISGAVHRPTCSGTCLRKGCVHCYWMAWMKLLTKR